MVIRGKISTAGIFADSVIFKSHKGSRSVTTKHRFQIGRIFCLL